MTSPLLTPVLRTYHERRATWTVRVTHGEVIDAVEAACERAGSGCDLRLLHDAQPGVVIHDGDASLTLRATPTLSAIDTIELEQFAALVSSDLELVRLRATSRSALRQSQKVARQLHQIIASALQSASADTASGVLVTLARAARSLFDGDESWAIICDGPFAPLAVRCQRGQPPQRLTLSDDDFAHWCTQIPASGPVVAPTAITAALRDDAGGTYGLVHITRPSTDVDVEGELVSLVSQIAMSSLTAMTLQHSIAESEHRLRVVIDTAPVAIVESDAAGAIVWANPRARALLGDGTSEVRTWPAVLAPLVQDLWHSDDHRSRELPPLTLHDRVTVLTAAAAPLAPTGGTLTVLDDVTNQRALKEEMRQANRMEIRGQVASAIAHDFNNLLTLITGYVDLLGGRVSDDSTATGLLASIATTTSRAAALTAQLQSVGRTATAQMAPVEINAALLANAEVLERVLGSGITITWQLTDAATTTTTDADLFEQMVLNLSTNARDAMEGSGTLTFTTTIEERPSDGGSAAFVRLDVTDTGAGMSAEVMAQCFEPLFSTKGPLKGTGMGLAGARRLVEESRGHVGVDSTLGVGTTFHLYFPCVTALATTPTLTHHDAIIAVVDDDVALRQLMVHLLRRYGYEVREYSNPLDVSADPTMDEVTLLVSDVMMPELTGVELARSLGQRYPELAILLVSGTADRDVLEGLGPTVELLAKPFRPSELVDAVHQLLARRTSQY